MPQPTEIQERAIETWLNMIQKVHDPPFQERAWCCSYVPMRPSGGPGRACTFPVWGVLKHPQARRLIISHFCGGLEHSHFFEFLPTVERGPVLSFSPENKTPCQLGQTRRYSYASSPQLAPGQCPNGCLGHIQTQKHAHSTSQTNPTPRGAFVLKRRLASFSAENEPRDTDFTVALGP